MDIGYRCVKAPTAATTMVVSNRHTLNAQNLRVCKYL